MTLLSERKAGRELDALVADKVMAFGWGTYEPYSNCEACRGDTVNCQVPHYSTEIGDAMLVVAALRAKGWVDFDVQSFPSRHDSPDWNDSTPIRWVAHFSRYRSPLEASSELQDSAAMALCVAALRAMGVE